MTRRLPEVYADDPAFRQQYVRWADMPVLHASNFDTVQEALDRADSIPTGIEKLVHAPDLYDTSIHLAIGDNTILAGGGTGVITKTSGTAHKMILNKTALNAEVAGNSGITIRDITLVGDSQGNEFSAGIHLVECIDCLIDNVTIRNPRGDGITIGNIHGGTVETCDRITVRNCKITAIGRMGIALTDARRCNIIDNYVWDCPSVAIDLEPDFAGQYMQANLVHNNNIWSCGAGVAGTSPASMPFPDVSGNIISKNRIFDTDSAGIGWNFSYNQIIDNFMYATGGEGVRCESSAGIGGITIKGNTIIGAGRAADATYAAILLNNATTCLIANNEIDTLGAPQILYLWEETGSCGRNLYTGNVCSNVNVGFVKSATSQLADNMLGSTAEALAAPWTAVAGGVGFANSWVDYGAGLQPVQFRKVGDMVQLRGFMKDGTVGATAFTLPAGSRPPLALTLPVVSNGLLGVLGITNAGAVSITPGSNVYVCLDGLAFSVTA